MTLLGARIHATDDWSGQPFGAPSPKLLTRAWQVKHQWRSPAKLTQHAAGAVTTLLGEDSIDAVACLPGLPVYCGYYNGTFANLNAFRADFPNAVILSITPNGDKGARCIDCEPGDATVAEAADFVAANLPDAGGGGRNDGGKPMVYCSAGDSQAVINAVAAKGISRSQWVLFSAHWIGLHICSPGGCGYPQADATQYASNANYDSDVFYSYCFGVPAPTWPLTTGSSGALVTTLQQNINKWIIALASAFNIPLLNVDGQFGPVTATAVRVAQLFFGDTGPAGTCDQAVYNDLAGPPVPNPPPPPSQPWPLTQGDSGATVVQLQANLVKWKFASADMKVFPIDGSYGPKTAAAVAAAEQYFKNGGPSGECDQALFNDLAAAPPPPPFAYKPVTGLRILGAGPHSVKFEFTANVQLHPGLAKFEVVVCKGDKLGPVIPTYPRYVPFLATGHYGPDQLGGVVPGTGYVLAVRGMAQDGSHASEWALAHFETAPA